MQNVSIPISTPLERVNLSDADSQRFWSVIDKNGPANSATLGPCWISEKTNRAGYGYFFLSGKLLRSHRVSFMIFRGPIPFGIKVCHECDTPSCVNPSHLFLGTQKDNIRDSMAKGRMNHSANAKLCTPNPLRGEASIQSKLTERDVISIRADYKKGNAYSLADKYGVACRTIMAVVHRRTWKHLT